MRRLRGILFCTLFYSLPGIVFGSHIFGGNVGMKALLQRGYFQISLTLFFDMEGGRTASEAQQTAICIIRSVVNGQLMDTIVLPRQQFEPLTYKNASCVQQGKLRTATGYFTKEIFLDPSVYNQPQGYQIIFSTCCRNDAISNIQNAITNEGVIMLQFPAITQNGAEFRNSSPEFGLPNGDYICLNKPFDFNFSATDADGDELRYSFATPYAEVNLRNPAVPFLEVTWASGFGLSNFIPGPRLPVINSRTGMMALIANRAGIYAFTVLVEEYRGGRRIGLVRRDFQLPVTDCKRSTLKEPVVFTQTDPSLPAQSIKLCEGESVTLTTVANPGYAYQWQKDNRNVAAGTGPALTIDQPGDYRLFISALQECAGDTNSTIVSVRKAQLSNVPLMPTDTLRFCNNDSALLNAPVSSSYQYNWFKDGMLLTGQNGSALIVKNVGRYVLSITAEISPGCRASGGDTVDVLPIAIPNVRIRADKNFFCPNDSVVIRGQWTAQQSGLWYHNNEPLVSIDSVLYVKQEGAYHLVVMEENCKGESAPVVLHQKILTPITFDSIPNKCYDESTVIALRADPAGGIFSGPGVAENQISVKDAGVGMHEIRYELKSDTTGCAGSQSRSFTVYSLPSIDLPSSVSVVWGGSVILKSETKDPDSERFNWSPPTGLDDPTLATPAATVQENTTYSLEVTSAQGCVNTASVMVLVKDLVFIPEVFSPNNDGINDVLEIKKNGDFTNLELYIYNRWGEVIFHEMDAVQHPWDGTYLGQKVGVGTYGYVVRNSEKNLRKSGTFLVLY